MNRQMGVSLWTKDKKETQQEEGKDDIFSQQSWLKVAACSFGARLSDLSQSWRDNRKYEYIIHKANSLPTKRPAFNNKRIGSGFQQQILKNLTRVAFCAVNVKCACNECGICTKRENGVRFVPI